MMNERLTPPLLRETRHDDVLTELYAVRKQMAQEAGNDADQLFNMLRERHQQARSINPSQSPIYIQLN